MVATRIAASYAQLLYDYLENRGLDAEQLLGAKRPDETQHFVPMSIWQLWLSRVDALERRPALGLRIAQSISARHFGVLGYAALACGTVAEALQRLERYHASVYDANPASVSLTPEGVVIEWGIERGKPGALVDETAIASLVQLARDMTEQHWPLHSVSFVNPQPADIQPYVDFFGGEVRFGAPVTRLVFGHDCLALPVRKSDPALLALMDRQAERLLQQVAAVPAEVEAWRKSLIPLIRQGRMSLASLASEHHTSPRSLQRRLSEQGISFQHLLDTTRQHLAEGYLLDAKLDMVEITVLLGYSEQSAFTRAFRSWVGLAPAQWRRHQLKATK